MGILADKKKIHFVGIGGIGMSGLAQLLIQGGYEVSGSDIKSSRLTDKLAAMGADIRMGHRVSNLKDADLAVCSSCIGYDNEELKAVRDKNIPLIQRGELLAELLNEKAGIAVAGTHGKTTTSSLISHILFVSGIEPSVAVGAEVHSLGGNALFGKGRYFVAEADESDGSFLHLRPVYSVITNIEREHLDFYGSLEEIMEAYRKFAANTKEGGCLFVCGDEKNLMEVLSGYKGETAAYGFNESCDVKAYNVKYLGCRTEFDCFSKGGFIGRFLLNIPGRHNVLNALAAIAIALKIGVDKEDIKKALASYNGARRRFEIKGRINEVMVIEDYAHHPTEIRVTLKAASGLNPKRIIAVFQPHRYSRTMHLKDLFSDSLSDADYIVLTDIYPASEKPIKGITSRLIYEGLIKKKHKEVSLISLDEIVNFIIKIVRPEDIVLIMGAGDVGKVSGELVERLKKQNFS